MSLGRKNLVFDDDWLFFLGDSQSAQQIEFDDSQWRNVQLPHDFSIDQPVQEHCPSGRHGGYFPGGIGWYRKRFAVAAEEQNNVIAIEFDGVYRNSDVWLNGHHLGHHCYGYTGFRYILNPHLNFGGENVIAVRVDNSLMPNSRWYSGSGIYRHTRLVISNPIHIAHGGVQITTPRIDPQSAAVLVQTIVQNETEEAHEVALATSIRDADGNVIACARNNHRIAAGAVWKFVQMMEVTNPSLWSPQNPYLYSVSSQLLNGEDSVDEEITTLGIRYFNFNAAQGFSLNGTSMKFQGVCLHHDGGCVGAAVPEGVWIRRLKKLKEMGCNAIRTSHNPPAPEFLDLCDQLGFMVMDETFDQWTRPKIAYGYALYFKDNYEQDLRSHLRRDRNHPCVLIWSIGNEMVDLGEVQAADLARRLVAICHQEDPTRPVTAGLNFTTRAHRSGLSDTLDIVGYNGGGGSKFQYEGDHLAWPERKMIGTEVPHTNATRGVYRTITRFRDQKNATFGNMMRIDVPDLTDEEVFPEFPDYYSSSYDNSFVRCCIRDCWDMTKRMNYICGEFRWTGIDHLGETREWPARSNNVGVLDLCGFKKDPFYYYQSQWTKQPMIHLLPHWTWPGKEGITIPVWAYTNCDAAELFLNERSLGKRKMGRRMNLSWDVPYEPGILRAEGYLNGEKVCAEEIKTAGAPAALRLSIDRDFILADGIDVVHAEVAMVDAQQNFVPIAENLVTLRIEGEGRLIGIDNGDPVSHHCFQGNQVKAFFGLCMGIVQTTRTPGRIRIIASSEGLGEASAELLSK